MTLLANIPYPGEATSDVAGYVHGGVEYAIVGHESGTTILNLADPHAPVVAQEIPAVHVNLWHEVDVYQDYAYVASEAGDGLRIINLSSLPSTCAYKDTIFGGMTSGHTLMVSGDRLYIFGANIDNGGVSVFSLVDPWRPVQIGAYNTHYVHDAYVRGDTCYLGEIYGGFMTMVDMRNPMNPVVLGSVQTPSAFTHNTWLNDAGNICFTTDEVNAAYVAAYDVSDPNNISEVNRYRSSLSAGASIPHNVKVLNDFLVIAYYKDGVNIVDASRPHNLVEVGYYDTNPASGGGFDGNWGLECYLPSGIIVACDMSTGVWILQPEYKRGCYLEGQVTDASNGNPITGANVTILSTVYSDQSNALGDYATAVADSGLYQVKYSKYGYRDSIITVSLYNGVLNVQNIALTPNPLVPLTVHVIDANTGSPVPFAHISMLETANQVEANYVADANGLLSDPNFMSSNYEVIAGLWGYVTNGITTDVNATTNNFTISLTPGYYDDFALDFGWTVTGNASNGMWERGEPKGTVFYTVFANPEQDNPLDWGTECLVTGNAGGDPNDDDVDLGHTVITSPVMDLGGYTNPWLIFDYWMFCSDQQGMVGFRDSLRISVSNGIETKKVWSIRDVQRPLWTTDTVQLASFLAITNDMRIIISADDILADQIVEAGIDLLRIEDQSFVANAPAVDPLHALRAYPNPSTGRTNLFYDIQDQASGTILIQDLDGREIKRIYLQASSGIVTLDAELAPGMYFAVLEAGGQRLATQKIIRL